MYRDYLLRVCFWVWFGTICTISYGEPTTIQRKINYQIFKYNESNTVILNSTTEQIIDFYDDSPEMMPFPTRIKVSTNSTDTEFPVFITATQQKESRSWALSRAEEGRTLCPHDAAANVSWSPPPLLQLVSAARGAVAVSVQLLRVTHFYVHLDKEITMSVTPTTPKYYFFSFDRNPMTVQHALGGALFPSFNNTIPPNVMVRVESDDDVCAIVSIQNNSCPVFDSEAEVPYRGYRLSMTRRGGLILTRSMFPQGFYVVLIVKQDDQLCSGTDEDNIQNRTKTFRLSVREAVSYRAAATGALALLGALTVGVLGAAGLAYCSCHWAGEESAVVVEVKPEDEEANLIHEQEVAVESVETSCVRELTLQSLARGADDQQRDRDNMQYFWSSLTVSVVYALPVVQLLVTYQNMILSTGLEDLCYYNALCAIPVGPFHDFNHVFSNVGYVVLGLAVLVRARYRQIRERGETQLCPGGEAVGVPRQYGLQYALCAALVMEGLLSACYHLCPNKMNFQFDSSFMYVCAVLTLVALYQRRHPDRAAAAPATFLALAAIMALGVYGIMFPSVTFKVLFTALHLFTCLYLTLNIYYIGNFTLEWSRVRGSCVAVVTSRGATLRPARPTRAVLLAVANMVNLALAVLGVTSHGSDLARHLLTILLVNAAMHLVFYVTMKFVHKETLLLSTVMYLIVAAVFWVIAGYFFLDSRTKWSMTPAQSRTYNRPCDALQSLDAHDLWHLASAAALAASLHALLDLDSPLHLTPRRLIPVF